MKHIIQFNIVILFLALFFTGCEVGITPLEQVANEVNIVTTSEIDTDGNNIIRTEIPESAGDVDVRVEIYGDGSEYFTVELSENMGVYEGLITEKSDNPPFYQNTSFNFFTRFVLNGQKQCEGTVTRTIRRTEVAPVAKDINVTLNEKTSITIELNATDKNTNDSLSYHIVDKPKHGTLLSDNAARPIYTDINSSGVDSFTYTAYDGQMFSHVATVYIILRDVDGVIPDTTKPIITLNGEDVNLTVGDIYIDAGATALDNVDGNITADITIVNPVDTSIVGTYTISYDVNDSAGNVANTVSRMVTVASDIIKPVIVLNGSMEVNLSVGDVYIDAGATASDNVDGDITSNIVVTKMVDTAQPGTYIVTYDVNDSSGNAATQVIRKVNVVNSAPVATSTFLSMPEDTYISIVLIGSDSDSNASILTYHIVSQPSNGTVTLTGNTAIYAPDTDYFGADGFTFEVRDEFNATSNIASIDLNITDVAEPNTLPMAEDMNISMQGNIPSVTFELNASDIDVSDILTYRIVTSPAYGVLRLDDNKTGQVTYNRGGYTGNTSFTYRVNDGKMDSNIATVNIKSNVPNSPPVAYDTSIKLDVTGAPIIILDANDTDSGDTLSYRIVDAPSYGTVAINANQATYTPNSGYAGNDSFKFVANDGKDDSNAALVYVEVGSTILNSHLFAWCNANDTELWESDGTVSGTSKVKDIKIMGSSSPQSFVKINNTYFFMADDGIHGRELWKSQGTEGSTVLVKDIKTRGDGHASPYNLTDINGTLFFAAKDGINGIELWKSDGTTLGTVMVKNINKNGHSKPKNLTNVNGALYFTADNGKSGRELWRSDGTASGTNQVNDIYSGQGSSNPESLTNIGGVLWFSADDGGTLYSGLGRELWYYNTNISDEASNYTNRGFFDIYKGLNASNPINLYNYNGVLVFTANNGAYGYELWQAKVGSLGMYPNFAGDSPFEGISANPHGFTNIGEILYFSASRFTEGYNLRQLPNNYTATIEDTLYVDTSEQLNLIPNPQNLVNVAGTLFFNLHTVTQDENGTVTAEDIYIMHTLDREAYIDDVLNGRKALYPYEVFNNELLFRTTKTDGSEELWISNIGNKPTLLTRGCGL